jgi:hypothetical protein
MKFCQKDDAPFYQCCCKCEHLRKVVRGIDFKRTRKYVCAIPIAPFAYEIPKHYVGCELYTEKREVTK